MKPIREGDFSLFYKKLSDIKGEYNRGDLVLIYAPDSGASMVVDLFYFIQIKNNSDKINEMRDLLLKTNQHDQTQTRVEKHIEFIPTLACNLRCSYCYAQKAHRAARLSEEHYINLVNYLMCGEDNPETEYRISFVGGGEPFLEWEIMRKCMRYAVERASMLNRKIKFSVITNGVLLNSGIIDTLIKYGVTVRFSFEILEEIQDLQRGNYKRVARNIWAACKSGLKVGIRSIITSNNVLLQPKMVEVALDTFPDVKNIDFEPVSTNNSSCESLKKFYDDFSDSFFLAYDIAQRNSVYLDCILLRMARGRGEYFCPNDFCISPNGNISACHRCVVPEEQGYMDFRYGDLQTNGKLQIDSNKYNSILERKKADSHDECKKCFARRNCSGGCLYQRLLLKSDQFHSLCISVRKFLIMYLLRKQNEAYFDHYGKTLKSHTAIIR